MNDERSGFIKAKILVWMALSYFLIAIWTIPETIALRNGVAVALLIFTLVSGWRSLSLAFSFKHWLLLFSFFSLTLWVTVVALFFAVFPEKTAGELWSQWYLPCLFFLAGTLFAFRLRALGEVYVVKYLTGLFWWFFFLVLLCVIFYFYFFLLNGSWPYRSAPLQDIPKMAGNLMQGQSLISGITYEHGEKLSYFINLFSAFIAAEIVYRLRTNVRGIGVKSLWLYVAVGFVVFCSFILKYRNGSFALFLLLIIVCSFLLLKLIKESQWKRLALMLFVAIIGIASLGYSYWKSDARWLIMIESSKIGWDTSKHSAWLSPSLQGYPKLDDGREVDQSAYERTAWFKEGSRIILEYPLGVGANRTAFSDILDQKHNLNGAIRGKHAHSAVIDFTLQNGLPGLLLWLLFAFALINIGLPSGNESGSLAGYFLVIFVIGYLVRSLVDSNMKDHMIQQFMFMSSLLAVLASSTQGATNGE